MLRIKNVRHSFGKTEINYPDWEIENGGDAMILGNSGSGKTTLLHILTGMIKPSEGTVEHDGQFLTSMDAKRLDIHRGKFVGIVFQKPHLIKSLRVRENIRLAGKFSGTNISEKRLDIVMDSLDISDLGNRKIHELSEGQAQRVSIARSVVHEPDLIAADEPTASLDDENCKRVVTLLKEQAERCKATLLVATHDQRIKEHFNQSLEL